MPFALIFTDSYLKRAKKFARKHPELKQQYLKTLQLLELNPYHPSLRLHQLTGNLKDVHSISINLSYRITIELLIEDNQIIPINIGTHEEVYR
jgi:mRNA-degrading endonuclease YafQ of YafQ-DinJ toxin-antitoxin module